MRLLVLAACAALASAADLPVAPAVDLPRYMGTWHEIAHLPNYPQRGCTDTAVHYRLNEEGAFDLTNTCRKKGRLKSYAGKAARVEPGSDAKFRVKFFAFFRGDYWILDLDPDYRWAVVGSPDREGLWIISRETTLDAGVYAAAVEKARRLGFPVERLVRTARTG
ncbi:MAG: lipocalin family protein [Elusimicrobiota bacterium]|nr:lipocalin family protein [Elusimicrobiota bacterium]